MRMVVLPARCAFLALVEAGGRPVTWDHHGIHVMVVKWHVIMQHQKWMREINQYVVNFVNQQEVVVGLNLMR